MVTHSSILAGRIPIVRRAWWAVVYVAAKSQTRLSDEAQHRFNTPKLNLVLGQSIKKFTRALLVVQWLQFPCQCREHRCDPWSQKIPHALEQTSLCATTAEPTSPRVHVLHKRSHHNEKPAHGTQRVAQLTTTTERPRAATKTQWSQTNKSLKKIRLHGFYSFFF